MPSGDPPSGDSPPDDPSSDDPSPGDSPSDDPPPGASGSESFGTRLRRNWERATENLPLAVVPMVSSLLAPDNVRRVLTFEEEFHLGVAFRFPSALPDLWTFVSVPNQGSGVHVSPTLFLLPVVVVVQAVLVAGLLGSAHQHLRTGGYDFKSNVRGYFLPVVAYVALVRIVGVATFSVAAVALPLVLLLVPAFLVLSYLLYAAPYLLVVADAGVVEALTRSYEWAVSGGPYFAYGAGYLLAVAGVSLVGTAVTVNLRAVGVLVGAVASAPVALALTFATTEFVAELADEEGV